MTAASADKGPAGARPVRAAAGYRRSAGSARGQARRQQLLDKVVDDLAANGLADFSLRRAARAAGTTHKVLLYYFDGPEDLLSHAVERLRGRRISNALAGITDQAQAGQTLAARVRAMWPALIGEGAHALDQAIGLALYDPERYVGLGASASRQYMPFLLEICPPHWSDRRKLEVSEMIMATLRGFVIDRNTTGSDAGAAAGFEALARALDREEAAG
jgi:AcrR family transcriptional regulator